MNYIQKVRLHVVLLLIRFGIPSNLIGARNFSHFYKVIFGAIFLKICRVHHADITGQTAGAAPRLIFGLGVSTGCWDVAEAGQRTAALRCLLGKPSCDHWFCPWQGVGQIVQLKWLFRRPPRSKSCVICVSVRLDQFLA